MLPPHGSWVTETVAEGTGLGSEVKGCGPRKRCHGAVRSRKWMLGSCRLATKAGTTDDVLVWFTSLIT